MIRVLMFIATVVLLLTSSCCIGQKINASPILIVPGLRGSRLKANIDSQEGDTCSTNNEWLQYWIDFSRNLDCVNKTLTLNFNPTTSQYSDLNGFQVLADGFGWLKYIEYLDSTNIFVPYFYQMATYFKSKGYIENQNISAAPYDWRHAPYTLAQKGYFKNVKSLIEKMYEDTGTNTKVTIVAHSMGGPVSLYFLNYVVTQSWKDKYIHAYIPLSGAWSGGNRGLLAFVSEIETTPYVKSFAKSFPTMESAAWLLPNPSVWKNTVVITTNNNKLNYTTQDYKQMFYDIGRNEDYVRWVLGTQRNGQIKAPNVTTYCFYGLMNSNSTPEVFHYGNAFPNSYQSTTNGPGDTIVNQLDSKICLQWKSQQSYPFYSQTFPYDHMQMVEQTPIFDAIWNVVSTPAQKPGLGGARPPPPARWSLMTYFKQKILQWCYSMNP